MHRSNRCLFCDQRADSKEHLWSSWILEMRPQKNWGKIRHSIGGSRKIIPHAELTVGTVCGTCNNGWMSDLETGNRALIGCMLQDIATPLDASQQTSLAVWTLKTAMVLDSVNSNRNHFYERRECEDLRLHSTIPPRTRIWIGRFAGSQLSLDGTDIQVTFPEISQVVTGYATTILVGHLAVQILSLRVASEQPDKPIQSVKPKPGSWDYLLLETWPIGSRTIQWPPRLSFTNGGALSFATLADRWRIGREADD